MRSKDIMNIIALIPSYADRGYLDAMLAWLEQSGEVDDIITLIQDEPLGASNARRELINQAFAKHGENATYLMLDDDCVFSEKSNIRDASKHFDELKGVGIIGIPTDIKYLSNKYYYVNKAYHCMLISGKVLSSPDPLITLNTGTSPSPPAGGESLGGVINYKPNEYCDEIHLSIAVYLAGFELIQTQRAAIWHHAALHKAPQDDPGINATLILSKQIPVQSTLIKDYEGLIKYEPFQLFDVEMPKFFSIGYTKQGREMHNQNRKNLKI